MKILHISTSDRRGGAAIATYRMMEAMCNFGIDAKMLVLKKYTDDDRVYPVGKKDSFFYYSPTMIMAKLLKKIKSFLFHPRLKYSCGISGINDISNISLVKESDIIYIHWIQDGFLNLRSLKGLIKTGKPIVFFLHDMWLTAGGCHYPIECEKWKKECSACPKIRSCTFINISYWNYNRKRRLFRVADNCTIMSPSTWTHETAQISPLLKNLRFAKIPNTLNTNTFRVIDRLLCRKILGLPVEKKLLLFGAMGGSKNKYKGWNIAIDIMKYFGNKYEYVVFGNKVQDCSFNVHSMGSLTDEYSLALLYNAVDIYVSPTLIETFGQTLAESIACGTPVVVTRIGGVVDIVNHMENGYLANPTDISDFCFGITWALGHQWDRDLLHNYIENRFSYETVIEQHKKLIEEINLSNSN